MGAITWNRSGRAVFFVNSWLLILFAGGVARDVGIKPGR